MHQAGGYKGWMWTVGKANFGENERHPAVMEALDRMVEFILKNQRGPERVLHARLLQQTVRWCCRSGSATSLIYMLTSAAS
jgi:hypothetical protein